MASKQKSTTTARKRGNRVMETSAPVVTFADYIKSERERLVNTRTSLVGEQRDLNSRLTQIDRELTAITAYESVKSGRHSRALALLAPPRRSAAQAQVRHGRASSKRAAIVATVKQAAPEGLKRGEILAKMGLSGDKKGEMSVSNALTNLVKTSQLARVSGRYTVPVADQVVAGSA